MQTKTKLRHVWASFLALTLCVTMLIGSTYAWFTDTVTSSGNIIKSGTLSVGMLWTDGDEDPVDTTSWIDVEDESDPSNQKIFGYELWEPGYVQVRHIKVINKGTLALKYNLTMLAKGDAAAAADLAEVIDVYTKTPAVKVADRGEVATKLNRVGTLREVMNDTTVLAAATQGHLSAGKGTAVITIALKMQETAGNEYQDKQVNAGFDIKLFATQWTEEEDTFDNQYDKMATYDSTNVTNDLHLSNNGATVTVPAGSANVNDVFVLNVTNNGNNTDTDGKTTASFDVKLFKNGTELSSADVNNTEYTVEINVGKNLDIIGVYHNGVPVLGWTYNSTTGIVTFTTKSFSPFTVEFHEPKLITFNGNGSTDGSMDNQNIYAGVAAKLNNNAFTKTGYSFAGWATTANGDAIYNDGVSVSFTEGTTLYAKWNANPYEVSFNAQGGTGEMANQTIYYDQTAKLTAVGFTKDGYNFVGWATEENGAKVYDNGASYTMQSTTTVTLYAVWSAIDYDVEFNANGGNGTMTNQTITFDDTEKLTKSTFTKTGYSFEGWATTADGYAEIADEADYKMETVGGVTLYATWTANNYDVVFNANGGNGTMTKQTIAYDSTAKLTANAFTRKGYSFVGWATSANGDVVYTDGAGYTMNTEGATLYAVWTEIKPNSVTIKKDGTATTSVTATTGQNFTLTAEVAPGTALNTSVLWSSSDENVATVNTNGLVTAKSVGTAIITATCNGDNDVNATCTLTVLLPAQYRDYNTDTGIFTNKTAGVIPITADMTTLNNTGISNGWYAVTEDVTISDRITVSGTVHLILADGTTLNANKGITVGSDNTLSIYGQSNGTGTLNATGFGEPSDEDAETFAAGIGEYSYDYHEYYGDPNITGFGTVNIHGGNINATGGESSAGIGLSLSNSEDIGPVNIYGGTIIAQGGSYAAGIGGGDGNHGCTVNIYEGKVTATGGRWGAGIGGGYKGAGGDVTIHGGTVTATGGSNGAGIGAGNGVTNHGTLTVATGWTVYGGSSANPTAVIESTYTSRPRYMVVKEKEYSYREYNVSTKDYDTKSKKAKEVTEVTSITTTMSDGWYVVTEDVTISDRITVSGTVNLILADGTTLNANKGITVGSDNTLNIYSQSDRRGQGILNASADNDWQAAIGGSDKGESGGNITINGGEITATSSFHGAGIGGAQRGNSGIITINGGRVTATGYQGAAIGGGNVGSGETITINGGWVTATVTEVPSLAMRAYGAGIGGGGNGSGGNITINAGTVKATGGNGSNHGIGGGGNKNGAGGSNGTLTVASGWTVYGDDSIDNPKTKIPPPYDSRPRYMKVERESIKK